MSRFTPGFSLGTLPSRCCRGALLPGLCRRRTPDRRRRAGFRRRAWQAPRFVLPEPTEPDRPEQVRGAAGLDRLAEPRTLLIWWFVLAFSSPGRRERLDSASPYRRDHVPDALGHARLRGILSPGRPPRVSSVDLDRYGRRRRAVGLIGIAGVATFGFGTHFSATPFAVSLLGGSGALASGRHERWAATIRTAPPAASASSPRSVLRELLAGRPPFGVLQPRHRSARPDHGAALLGGLSSPPSAPRHSCRDRNPRSDTDCSAGALRVVE